MIETVLEFFSGGDYIAWVNAITGVVTAATAVTMLTPTKTDNKIVDSILAVLNIISKQKQVQETLFY